MLNKHISGLSRSAPTLSYRIPSHEKDPEEAQYPDDLACSLESWLRQAAVVKLHRQVEPLHPVAEGNEPQNDDGSTHNLKKKPESPTPSSSRASTPD